jgi:3-hydroxyisobutyrate dehydrogenase-like beta-hydroxyacid dehydrogenase
MRIGFLGAGVMAQGMVANLLAKGHQVTLYNRTRERAQPLLDLGARWADTPAQAAQGQEAVLSCVADGSAVAHLALGPQGIREGAAPGLLYVDLSTISPSQVQAVAQELASVGVEMVDAPVTGLDKGAREGTLTAFVGGSPQAVERARPILEAFCRRIHVMGDLGSGQAMKLLQNLVGGLNLLAAAEGARLGEAYGFDPVRALRLLADTVSHSRMVDLLAERLESKNTQPGFALRHRLKDFYLALDLARERKVPLPLAAMGATINLRAHAQGLGEFDQSQVWQVVGR